MDSEARENSKSEIKLSDFEYTIKKYVVVGTRRFKFFKPIEFEYKIVPTEYDSMYVIDRKDIGIVVNGETLQELYESLIDDIMFIYDEFVISDEPMSQDAINLKNIWKELITEIK